jgi:ABC-type multidrug transport system fused ATPase/permease subunit
MDSWFTYLKNGLSRTLPDDRIAGRRGYGGAKANLQNLRPFLARHWRKGILGTLLIFFNALLSFPQPLITRYIVDDVILGRQLGLLAGAILLLAAIVGLGKLSNLLQQFYFARFEQEVLLDIQGTLLERALRFPKSFFDDKETGYLMSRLSSDVGGLRWFFSSTLVHVASNLLRFVGGVGLLFYLEWRLAIATLLILPGLVVCVRYFSGKMRILSHRGMEQRADVSRHMQESLSSTSLIKAFSAEKQAVGRVMAAWQNALHISLEQTAVNSVANLAISLIPDIARAVALVAGAYWIIRGEWTLGSLLAFQSYLGYVYGPATFLANANLQLQNALAALERVSALFDIVPEEALGVGCPAAEYELGSLRRRIGYVSQSTLLLSGTIGDNLRYGNPEASEAEVVRAAMVAGIHDFIAGLPEGYDSPVGERGVNLSEGQKQRLAIARALIKDPDILVLDEPTSALDSLVEKSIFDALPALVRGKTSFVVAHRLATIQNSDRILLLNEKRLVAMGTHQELLASNDYYRSLVANQQIIAPIR